MTVLKKEEIFKEFGKNKGDSGSSESQIALFTKRMLKILILRNLLLKWLVKEGICLSTSRRMILKDIVIL